MEEYSKAAQATDDNVAHAHFMLNTEGYKPTLRICNTYCFSTTKIVARLRLKVTLYCIACVVNFLWQSNATRA